MGLLVSIPQTKVAMLENGAARAPLARHDVSTISLYQSFRYIICKVMCFLRYDCGVNPNAAKTFRSSRKTFGCLEIL